ncbi:MAG TPA: hypothetical protein VMA53_13350 [Stellaceae bacterium]|nr:hypothetical protein [Stellaceae bacterium]
MAFPPRSRSARAEPSFTPLGAAPRDAVPLRAAAPRAASALRPSANDSGAEREPMRLSAEPRRGLEAPLTLTDADRIVVSSAITGGSAPRQTGFLRVLGFAVLLVLAAVGAYSLYLEIGPYLP